MRSVAAAAIIAAGLWTASTAAGEPSPFADAVTAWHFRDLSDGAGMDSRLELLGTAAVGIVLEGSEREESLRRGGDGWIATLDGGHLDAGRGASGELDLSGSALTLLVRFQSPASDWRTHGILSKYGGHERLVYNLYAYSGDLGFELGTTEGLFRTTVAAAEIGPTAWHDVVARWDGRRLELMVDGTVRAQTTAGGRLREGNREPVLIGAYSIDGKAMGPAPIRIDTAAIWSRALDDAEVARLSGVAAVIRPVLPDKRPEVAAFRAALRSRDVAVFSSAARTLRRFMRENDPHVPLYHFTAPESWLNDPNGVIHHDGLYHLFYQFDPIIDGRRSKMTWGHAVSPDLVHWVDWPVALWPDDPHDAGGVFSGNIAIDDRGVPSAFYTGNVGGAQVSYGMRAWSDDGLVTWKKKMVMDRGPVPGSPPHWDGQVWKDGGTWFQLIGGSKDGKGAAHLWSSDDLDRWTYRRAVFSGPPGNFWELPYLIPLGGRHVLLIGAPGNPYWVGRYDREAMEFLPDDPARPRQADAGAYYSFNPNMTDRKGPGGAVRRLMHGWVTGDPSPSRAVPFWQGAHSIPRVLDLDGDRLVQTPAPEIEVLRGKHIHLEGLTAGPGDSTLLPGLRGDALEVIAVFDLEASTAARFGLRTRASADGRTSTPAWLDRTSAQLGAGPHGGPLDRPPGRELSMRVFIDRSILEVYAGGSACTARMFPDPAATGVGILAEGGTVRVLSIDAWQMRTMWEP